MKFLPSFLSLSPPPLQEKFSSVEVNIFEQRESVSISCVATRLVRALSSWIYYACVSVVSPHF